MRRLLAAALLALTACCSPSHPRAPDSRSYHVEATGGDGQAGPVGAALPVPLSVAVTDWWGFPAPGVEVAFVGPFRGEALYAWTDERGAASVPAVPPALGTWQVVAQAWQGTSDVATFSLTGR